MPLEIYKGIYAVDLAVYLKQEKILIISDIHLGYEEHLAKQGVLVPRTQYKQTIKRLDYIFSKVKPDLVILNGDIKHEFGTVNPQEWREVLRLVEYLRKKTKKLIAVKGNHDTILGPIAKKVNIEEVKEYRVGKILIAHGDYIPEKIAPVIIIGHEHPAIKLREEAKLEKFKCFLKGKYKSKVLIVQPSFNMLTAGTDITTEKTISPFLKNVEDFQCYIVNDKTHDILDFGRIRELSG